MEYQNAKDNASAELYVYQKERGCLGSQLMDRDSSSNCE